MKILKALKLGHLAVIFGILGVVTLYGISIFSRPIAIRLDEVSAYEGRFVIVEGLVVDTQWTTAGDLIITLFGDQTTLKVLIQNCDLQIKLEDIVRVTGEVRKYKTEYEVVTQTDKTVDIIGHWDANAISLLEIPAHLNSYVKVRGIVIDKYEFLHGAVILDIFENDTKLTIFVNEPVAEVTIYDIIELRGIVQLYESTYELVVYDSSAIKIIGKLHISQVSIPKLAQSLQQAELKGYEYFEVNVTGYVRYEPYNTSVIYISEELFGGRYILKVRYQGKQITEILSGVHKGDLVEVQGTVSYEPSTLRYVLHASAINVVQPYGVWHLTLTQLVDHVHEYEYAKINITGYIIEVVEQNNTFMLTDNLTTCTYTLSVVLEDTEQTVSLRASWYGWIEGRLIYDPSRAAYVVLATKYGTIP